MKTQRLVSMANQIGDFFASYPDGEQAKSAIAAHIKAYWAKNMREQIVSHVLKNQGEGLHETVSAAIREHQSVLA